MAARVVGLVQVCPRRDRDSQGVLDVRHLPRTFFNLRLDPVSLVRQTPAEIRETVTRLVRQSDNPWLTGVCCINMDHTVGDEQICAIFDTVNELRKEYAAVAS